ncbi:MAG TPA: NAD(P)H-hydrate dehydratase, partial [Burkholderiales bacterium]|nr:NAD(P)H-hydrate dehydratase [Burkholderiales bacterium]
KPIYHTSEIRRIEERAVAQSDPPALMEIAGLAAAEIARDLLAARSGPVLVFAGPGNNGGDALVVARHLKRWWFDVSVVFTGNADRLSGDARHALDEWRGSGGDVLDAPPSHRWALVIDGLFGIGLTRDLSERYAALADMINAIAAPVLAIDVPSGLNADTGRVMGRAVRADHTATFIALKPGLLTLDGCDYCGHIHLCDLGLDATALVAPSGSRIGSGIVSMALAPRAANTHKGDYGSLGIIGGAPGMAGAALLAGRAALKLGTGRVYIGFLGGAPAYDPLQPELMLRTADEVGALDNLTALAVGPGLSRSQQARQAVEHALQTSLPLVLDADALNLIALHDALAHAVHARSGPTLMTPHPAEAARLLHTDIAAVQNDRVAAALRLADQYRAAVVLKGAGSICALPDGRWFVNTTGNPGMASAGMGDVLTGIAGALLAQRVDADMALLAAVHLHGAAADDQVKNGTGPAGLTAGEVTDGARSVLNRRVAESRLADD